MTKGDLLTIEDLAQIMPVGVRTLYGWHERNYGPPAARIGKRLVYHKRDVERFLEDAFGG
jgi:DNA-binding transcriptional MerR regulator